MSQQYLEELAESRVRSRKIKLAPAQQVQIQANRSFVLSVDYSDTAPEGISLPLILEVTGPGTYRRRDFLLVAPQSIVITPQEGGDHMVTLREFAHNKWFGSYGFTAEGPGLFRATL